MTPDAELQIFAIKRGQLEQRIDVSFYLPSMTEVLTKIKNSKYEVVHLNKLLDDLTDGTHYTPSYTEKGVKFISVTNITENKIDFENTKYISEKEHSEFIRRCNPESNSILLTKIGSIGRAAVIPESCPPFSIFVSVALLKVNKKIIPDFLCAYLNSSLALRQFERYLKGIGVPDLHLENIAQTQIIVPDRDEQKKFASDYMNAFANYQNKLLAAEELLAGMDEFVLDTLEIKIPSQADILCWAIRLGMLKQANTFSPEYFNHERLAVIKNLKQSSIPIFSLEEKVNFQRDLIDTTTSGHKFLGLASIQSNTGERVELEEQVTGNAFKYNIQNVLYCRLRPYLNKVYFAEESGVCSTEFHVISPKDDSILPEYLAIIMRSKLTLLQTKHMMTGNTHPRISDEDVKALVIPVPSKKVQQKIVDEYKIRTSRARQLRQEAEKEWQDAREQFEKELLGE